MTRPAHPELAEAFEAAADELILVVTGAGVSQASGIPTFRGADPDAIWEHSDMEMATFGFFEQDPVTQWRWYLDRFKTLETARPNPAHAALVALERWQLARGGEFLLVTQNIDCLHEEAGSREMIKVHGTADRVRCSEPGCALGAPTGSLPRADGGLDRFRAAPSRETLPRCSRCGAVLRGHILFFDEFYDGHRDYQYSRVREAASVAGLVLFAGTSFSVGVTDTVLWSAAMRRVPVFSIDPAASTAASQLPVTQLSVSAEEFLPATCRALGARYEPPAGYTVRS